MAAKSSPKTPPPVAPIADFKGMSSKAVLQNAIGFLAIAIIAKMAIYALGFHRSIEVSHAFMIALLLILIAIYVTINSLRKNFADLTLKQAFLSGARLVVLFSVAYAWFIYFYYQYIDVHFFTDRVKELVAEGKAKGYSEADLEALQKNAAGMLNSFFHSFFTFIGLILAGLVYAFTIAWLVLRKYRNLQAASATR